MNLSTTTSRVSKKQAIIDAGRAHLKEWLLAAEAHGTIYYNIQSVSRSGMSRKIGLSTIYYDKSESGRGAARLVRLWPGYGDQELPDELTRGSGNFSSTLDVIARDWGFSYDARAFNVAGCGSDMTFELVYGLARKVFAQKEGHLFACKVRRESF